MVIKIWDVLWDRILVKTDQRAVDDTIWASIFVLVNPNLSETIDHQLLDDFK
jgi:hypothetical protein